MEKPRPCVGLFCNFVIRINLQKSRNKQDTMSEEYKIIVLNAGSPAGMKSMVERIKTDAGFAAYFFYCAIAPMRARIISNVRRFYKVHLSEADFSTLLYEYLWSDGTWERLDSFNGKGSFFKWIAVVAEHQIRSHLVDMDLVPPDVPLRAGNSRLRLLSQPEYIRKEIVDMVNIPQLHRLLFLYYVEKKTREEIIRLMEISPDMFLIVLRAAEKLLKNLLIMDDSPYLDRVLVRTYRNKLVVSSDYLGVLASLVGDDMRENSFEEIFSRSAKGRDLDEKIFNFMYDFPSVHGWKERDADIWRRRYLFDEDPVALAQEYGMSRGWVDTRYSRLNRRFEKEIRQWWARVTY